MRIALTGASGFIGGFVLRAAREVGHQVTILDRSNGYRLGDAPNLARHDALIHCAFAHIPGHYRGGEGEDPAGFLRDNLDGSVRLFDAAAVADVPRILFLSSRAVHDGQPAGVQLTDDLPPSPSNLYGEVKARAEDHLRILSAAGLQTTAVRATGVYGPATNHKWQGLFADYLAGRPITPRVATEVHGDDLAAAMLLLLAQPAPPKTVNVSDLILDRHDLLAEVARLTGSPAPLPARADPLGLRILHCRALTEMGWRPGGMARLRHSLPAMLDPAT